MDHTTVEPSDTGPKHQLRRDRIGSRSAFRLAWGMWLLVLAVQGFFLVLWLGDDAPTARQSAEDVVTMIPFLVFATVGAVIIARRPGNRIGWLCWAIGFTISVSFLGSRDVTAALVAANPGRSAAWALLLQLGTIAWLGTAFPSTRPTGPARPGAAPAWAAPAAVGRRVTGRPSTPWSATASTTPPPTRPSSSAGGSAGPTPTSAWPPEWCSTPWTSTALRAWPPSASWHARRTCGSTARSSARGAVAGTTGSPPPGSVTAHPEDFPMWTGAAREAVRSRHPAATSPAAATVGCAVSTRHPCPKCRPDSAPCWNPKHRHPTGRTRRRGGCQ
jgi:hypothetical protein